MLPALAAAALPLIGGLISGFGAAAKEQAQAAAQEQYLREYRDYKRNVENAPQVTKTTTTHSERTSENTLASTSVDLKALVAASEAAGFNPLTVLQSGGMAYFSSSSTSYDRTFDYSDVSVMEAPKLWVPPAPRDGFSPGGAFASAFGPAVSSIDLSAAYSNYAQGQLAQGQLAALNRPQSFAVPTHVSAPRSGGSSMSLPAMGLGAGDNGEVLNLWTKWHNNRTGEDVWTVNPKVPEAEQFLVPPLAEIDRFVTGNRDYINPRLTPMTPGAGAPAVMPPPPAISPGFQPFSPTGPNWRPSLVR